MLLGIFKTALSLRDRHVFMWLSLEILNVFNTSTLKQIFWKTQALLKKMFFLVGSAKIKNPTFPYKLLCQKPMLRQIEWGVQNRPIIKNGVLSVTILFFRKFCLSLRTW